MKKSHCLKLQILLFTSFLATSGVAMSAPDAMEELIKKTNPPGRFSSHVPNFSAQVETFTFQENGKPKEQKFWTVKDGDRYVAVLHEGMCQLDMITFDPTKIPVHPPFKEYYGWGTLLGTRITTALWWDGMSASGDQRSIQFSGGGTTLALTVTESWSKTRNAESNYVMNLRCDPVHGYVWDIATSLQTDKVPLDGRGKPINPEVFNWQGIVTGWTQRNNQRWPASWVYERTVFYREDGKLVGFYMNPEANDRGPFKHTPVKNGGYVAMLPDKDGWGVALVHSDKGSLGCNNNTCNMWADSHNMIRLPETPGSDGLYRVNAKWRFLAVPPEAVNYILANTEMDSMGHQNTAAK